MSRNIIDAIITVIQQTDYKLVKYASSEKGVNKMNAKGSTLEEFVQNMFANTFGVTDPVKRMSAISDTFS